MCSRGLHISQADRDTTEMKPKSNNNSQSSKIRQNKKFVEERKENISSTIRVPLPLQKTPPLVVMRSLVLAVPRELCMQQHLQVLPSSALVRHRHRYVVGKTDSTLQTHSRQIKTSLAGSLLPEGSSEQIHKPHHTLISSTCADGDHDPWS